MFFVFSSIFCVLGPTLRFFATLQNDSARTLVLCNTAFFAIAQTPIHRGATNIRSKCYMILGLFLSLFN